MFNFREVTELIMLIVFNNLVPSPVPSSNKHDKATLALKRYELLENFFKSDLHLPKLKLIQLKPHNFWQILRTEVLQRMTSCSRVEQAILEII